MATYNKFNTFVQYVCNGGFNLGSDTIKVALSNVAPSASGTTFSTDITDLSATNGYTAGGYTLTGISSTQTSGTETFSANNASWTATSGSMPTFQYIVLYDSTPSTHNLIAWWDYGTTFVLTVGNTFTVQFNGGASSGTIFTMA